MAELKAKYPGAEFFKFGDSAELSAQLIDLVITGKKTATCGALCDFEEEGEALPLVGRRDVAMHWDGTPAVVIETTEVTQQRYCDVTEDFALAEGENETLAGWRRDHRAYFERQGHFADDMMLVCERFHVVEVIG